MGVCYFNKTIEIPIQGGSRSINLTPEVNGDMARTAGNRLRFDVSSNPIKRSWNLQTELLTQSQYNEIYNYLSSINFGFVDFWLDSFGGTAATDSITVKINITNSPREKVPGIYYGLSLSVVEQ